MRLAIWPLAAALISSGCGRSPIDCAVAYEDGYREGLRARSLVTPTPEPPCFSIIYGDTSVEIRNRTPYTYWIGPQGVYDSDDGTKMQLLPYQNFYSDRFKIGPRLPKRRPGLEIRVCGAYGR